jgi:hypothetical protein
MPKGKRINETVKVIARSVTYSIQDERLSTSDCDLEIRESSKGPDDRLASFNRVWLRRSKSRCH